jgi:hypothetical protein
MYVPSGGLYLSTDLAGWLGPSAPGAGAPLTNGQCTLNAAATTVSSVGNTVTVNPVVTFNSNFVGAMGVYAYASDIAGNNTGWQQVLTYTTSPANPQLPTGSVTPSSGTGMSQVFTVSSQDVNGWKYIEYQQLLIGPTNATDANSCLVVLNNGWVGALYLLNDANTQWLGPIYLNSPATLSNHQCTIDSGATTMTTSGNNLTFNLSVSFAASGGFPINQPQNIYLALADQGGNGTGWLTAGTWTVVTAPPETIQAPWAPAGPPIVLAGPTYTFTASGAASSLGHAIQYRFSWGDGSDSGWLDGTTVASHNWTAAGNYQVTLLARCATDNVVSPVSGVLQVSVQDFSLVANYSYAPVFAGNSISLPIATTCANGFAGSTLTITSVSYGNGQQAMNAVWPPAFSNWYPQCGSSTTITIQLNSGALPGFYQVTVTASGTAGDQSVQRSATLAVTVTSSQAAGIVATPYAQTVAPGGTATFSVTLINTNNFGGTLSLSCSPTSSLCPGAVTFGQFSSFGISTMTVNTAANTPPGVYNITVTGTSGQNPVSTNVALTVSSLPGTPVTITNSPSSSTFWVDGVAYAGSASFVPQPSGNTLAVTQPLEIASVRRR